MLLYQTTKVHSCTIYILHFSVIANLLKLTKIEICVQATVYHQRNPKRATSMADDALVRAQASESLALQMAMAAGNVNISGVQADTLDLSSNAQAAQERHAFVLAQLEAKRRARSVVLPTADGDVKSMLRTRGYPICLFGEKPEDRRVRLRKIVVHAVVMLGESEDAVATAAAATDSGSSSVATSSSSSRTKAQLEDEEFYTRGTAELIAARRWIAKDSWSRSQKRLAGAKRRRDEPAAAQARDDLATAVLSSIARPRATASQHGDVRPVCCVALSHATMGADFATTAFCATGSWSGLAKVWSADACGHLATLRAHDERVVDVHFRPGADLAPLATLERLRLERRQAAKASSSSSSSSSARRSASAEAMETEDVAKTALLATASADGTVMIWPAQLSLPDVVDDGSSSSSGGAASAAGSGTSGVATAKPLRTLRGHSGRLCKVRWDATGRLLASTGFDTTWRLWDAESGTQLLLQEGHTREAYSLAFHPDNSLIATGDFGGVIRLWDLRSGKAVAAFGGRNQTTAARGHHGHVTSLSFSPIAPILASGGSDNQARIWDLRKKKCAASVRLFPFLFLSFLLPSVLLASVFFSLSLYSSSSSSSSSSRPLLPFLRAPLVPPPSLPPAPPPPPSLSSTHVPTHLLSPLSPCNLQLDSCARQLGQRRLLRAQQRRVLGHRLI